MVILGVVLAGIGFAMPQVWQLLWVGIVIAAIGLYVNLFPIKGRRHLVF